MKKVFTLIAVLVVVLSKAQPLGSFSNLPSLIPNPSKDIPSSIPGMFIRLKGGTTSSLITGQNVSNLTDSVQGLAWTNSNSARWFTNAAQGLWVTSSHYLQSSNGFNWGSSDATLIIYKQHGLSAFGSILGNTGAEFLIGPLNAPNGFGSYQPQKIWAPPYPVSDVQYDVITVGGSDPVQCYTNGVAASSFSLAGAFTANMIGANQSAASDQYQGFISEIIVWTNVTLSTLQVSNLHYYSTNFSSAAPYSP